MATSKKTTKTVKKAAAAPKKKAAKVTKTKAVKVARLQDFKLGREKYPFMSFHLTEQTLYWTILLFLIMVLFLWVLKIQIDTKQIIQDIENINAASSALVL